MPILYQWNWNIDKLNNFSWLISPVVVQMVSVVIKTNISRNWRYFRLRLFLIFEHNVNCLMSLYDITVTSQGVPQLLSSPASWLIDHQLIQSYYKAVSVSKSRITGGISSGWVTANFLCHPDVFHLMSSAGWGWLNWDWYLIRVSYGNVIMSSGWHTLPFLRHPDEIANFDFPQQRFRNTYFENF